MENIISLDEISSTLLPDLPAFAHFDGWVIDPKDNGYRKAKAKISTNFLNDNYIPDYYLESIDRSGYKLVQPTDRGVSDIVHKTNKSSGMLDIDLRDLDYEEALKSMIINHNHNISNQLKELLTKNTADDWIVLYSNPKKRQIVMYIRTPYLRKLSDNMKSRISNYTVSFFTNPKYIQQGDFDARMIHVKIDHDLLGKAYRTTLDQLDAMIDTLDHKIGDKVTSAFDNDDLGNTRSLVSDEAVIAPVDGTVNTSESDNENASQASFIKGLEQDQCFYSMVQAGNWSGIASLCSVAGSAVSKEVDGISDLSYDNNESCSDDELDEDNEADFNVSDTAEDHDDFYKGDNSMKKTTEMVEKALPKRDRVMHVRKHHNIVTMRISTPTLRHKHLLSYVLKINTHHRHHYYLDDYNVSHNKYGDRTVTVHYLDDLPRHISEFNSTFYN